MKTMNLHKQKESSSFGSKEDTICFKENHRGLVTMPKTAMVGGKYVENDTLYCSSCDSN